ncbi:membrane associated rhomboid family serine protease [Nocardioides thalensis]|uniref:Membrane associated rhomboid family serine protease n=1 Tax=Nocardioides thalensis TaxID=1914755 RepID=A0A853C6C0_9ACTN|nr:membrane associated rhomboid family serine protease [Nocardioides thalensis]
MEIESRLPAWQVAGLGTIAFVVLLWVLEAVDAAMGHDLDQYGIQPRSDEGLLGILFAPVLHGGWSHLEGNTGPVLVLLFVTLATGLARGLLATAVIWVVGGLGVWLVAGSNSVHLGASGLVFGWIVYLGVRGIVNKEPWEILVGVVVLIVYGTVLLGVLPGQPGVSWQGHLFGAIGGAVAAAVLSNDRLAGARRVLGRR